MWLGGHWDVATSDSKGEERIYRKFPSNFLLPSCFRHVVTVVRDDFINQVDWQVLQPIDVMRKVRKECARCFSRSCARSDLLCRVGWRDALLLCLEGRHLQLHAR